jgi:hypothetical protein
MESRAQGGSCYEDNPKKLFAAKTKNKPQAQARKNKSKKVRKKHVSGLTDVQLRSIHSTSSTFCKNRQHKTNAKLTQN